MRPYFFFITLFMLLSCDEHLVDAQYHNIPQMGWELNDAATFEFIPQDTVQPYNLFINLRNTHEYEYNNLWLISQIKFPHGKVVIDTLQYEMAGPTGEFLGVGSGDVIENKLWLKEGVRFRESGTYQIALQHAMRKTGEVNGEPHLKGILEVGYSIEKQVQDGSK